MVIVAMVGSMEMTLDGPVKLQIIVSSFSLIPSCTAETETNCIPSVTPIWKFMAVGAKLKSPGSVSKCVKVVHVNFFVL